MNHKERINELRKEAQQYFATSDRPGSSAAGADSNHELGMMCLEEAERLEKEDAQNE